MNRLLLYVICICLGFSLLIGRLFYWQIVRGKELSVLARGQYENGWTLDASRGEILANDGTWLVASGEGWLVFADIPNIKDAKDEISKKLAPLFVNLEDVTEEKEKESLIFEEEKRIFSLLSRDAHWVPLKNKISTETKDTISNLKIAGIGFEKQETRVYPEGSVAAHILGFVGKNESGEERGYLGLEGYYDMSLTGKPGFLSRESDARGAPILFGDSRQVNAVGGIDLITHIDKTIQSSVERNLYNGLLAYGATAGTVIVMNPKNGAILAMASLPSYEPLKYYEWGDKYFTNPAISSTFEPGSIFKVVVMAAGLDAQVVEPDTHCDICSGPVKVDKYFIETWNKQYYPNTTMTEAIIHSDNTGMVFVARKLGIDNLYDYIYEFGFANKTGIDLQGEVAPLLREKKEWSFVDLATASFGQGLAVTPIQMITAVSAIANDGVLVQPQIVKKISSGDWEQEVNTREEKQVISKEAADKITTMMVEAASNGEAKWTYRRGFGVAGKTGTAQIAVGGKYHDEKTIASFIGFAPFDDPQFVMLVTLHETQSSQWASETAAPLWYDIAEDLFIYLGIHPKDE